MQNKSILSDIPVADITSSTWVMIEPDDGGAVLGAWYGLSHSLVIRRPCSRGPRSNPAPVASPPAPRKTRRKEHDPRGRTDSPRLQEYGAVQTGRAEEIDSSLAGRLFVVNLSRSLQSAEATGHATSPPGSTPGSGYAGFAAGLGDGVAARGVIV